MCIDLRCTHISMAQERLDRTDIATPSQQLSGKGVAECMAASRLANSRLADGDFDGPLNTADMNMMANTVAVFIQAQTVRGK